MRRTRDRDPKSEELNKVELVNDGPGVRRIAGAGPGHLRMRSREVRRSLIGRRLGSSTHGSSSNLGRPATVGGEVSRVLGGRSSARSIGCPSSCVLSGGAISIIGLGGSSRGGSSSGLRLRRGVALAIGGGAAGVASARPTLATRRACGTRGWRRSRRVRTRTAAHRLMLGDKVIVTKRCLAARSDSSIRRFAKRASRSNDRERAY